jgi:hypothetical protein
MDELIAVSSELMILVANTKDKQVQAVLKSVVYDTLSINRYIKISFRHPKSYNLTEIIEQNSLDLETLGTKLTNPGYMSLLNQPLPIPTSVSSANTSLGLLLFIPEISTLGVTIHGDIHIKKFNTLMSEFIKQYGSDIYQCYGQLSIYEPPIASATASGSDSNSRLTKDKFLFHGLQKEYVLIKSLHPFRTNSLLTSEENITKMIFVCKQAVVDSKLLIQLLSQCLVNSNTYIQVHSS